MKICIFGKNGQLGTELVTQFEKKNIPFAAFGSSECDVTDHKKMRELLTALRPSHIINATAYNLVDKAESDGKEAAYNINHLGVKAMASISHDIKAKLIHVSTDYVFDGEKKTPYTEEDATAPLNEYGKSKRAGEVEVLLYPEHTVLRTSWVFGKGQQNFIYKFLQNVQNNPGVLKATSDEVSIPTSTEVLYECIHALIQESHAGLYHATSSGFASRADWARRILEAKGISREIEEVSITSWNLPAKRPAYSVMSNEKIQSILKRTLPHWEEELEKYIHFF